MSFTAAYFLRLAVWALVLAGLLGGPVWISWYIWDRALRRVHAAVRFRVACGHFVAVLAIPAALIGFVHSKLIALGGEILRELPHTEDMAGGDAQTAQRMVLLFLCTWLAGTLLATIRLAIEAWQLARVPSRPAPAAFAAEVRLLASRTRVRRQPPTCPCLKWQAPRARFCLCLPVLPTFPPRVERRCCCTSWLMSNAAISR